MPGTLTAIPISKMLDVEEDFGFPPLTSSATFPLIYYYGYHSPADKPKLYTLLMKRLGSIVNRKIEEDTKVKRSGIIINTPYTFSDGGAGSELLASAIEFFQGTFYPAIFNFFFFPLLSSPFPTLFAFCFRAFPDFLYPKKVKRQKE